MVKIDRGSDHQEAEHLMTEEEAKAIIRNYGPPANVKKHIEAIETAVRILGEDVTMKEVWKWAAGK